MKKIVSILLLLCMVVTLCVSFTACDTETVTPYTRLKDHLSTCEGEKVVIPDVKSAMVVTLQRLYYDGNGDTDPSEVIGVSAEATANGAQVIRITFDIKDGSEKYFLNYSFDNKTTNKSVLSATAEVNAASYTGNDLIAFTSVTNIHTSYEFGHRQNITAILNSILKAVDTYLGQIDLSVTDFGFEKLSDKYLATNTAVEVDEDLGGIFSAERWIYSGEMLVLGVAMVFLVLAILWLVLIIFAKTMGGAEKKPAKADKPAKAETKPAPQVAPAPVAASAPATSDDAIVAAITAAIAMTIESDPALSSQFKSGFRVVSFQKKNGKNAWNR